MRTRVEKENDSKIIKFLYENTCGRLILKVVSARWFSSFIGFFLNTKLSTIFIKRFIKKNCINMNDYETKEYTSYNDFFKRKIRTEKRTIDYNNSSFISPADAKLCIYNIDNDSRFNIKNSSYTVADLIQDDTLAKEYIGGYCLIFRLTVDNYHRYIYLDDGYKNGNTFIKGKLYTVQPIALKRYNIYKYNSREYTILNTRSFDKVIQVEVGATIVGKINNYHEKYTFKKGEEKGTFEFGGSTIVLLIKKDIVDFDDEILKNSQMGYETIVSLGEKIGIRK